MLSRRKFLKNTGTVLTAMPVFGFGLLDSAGKGPLLGHGDFRYRLRSEWGKLDPEVHPVQDCHEMVQDRKGRLLMLGTDTHNNVLIYDRSGKLLSSWGEDFRGGHGLTLVDEGDDEYLWITDYIQNEVYKTTLNGRVLLTLGCPMESGLYERKNQYHPTETAVASNGDLYVADGYGLQYVHRYDSQGHYKGHFGGMGWLWKELRAGRFPHDIQWENDDHDPTLLNNAHGVTLDTRDKDSPILLVTSRMDNAIRRFSLEGGYLSQIDIPGAFVNRAVIHGENLYAAVLRSDRPSRDRTGFVTVLNRDDRVVSNPGGTRPKYRHGKLQQIEQAQPVFIHPHDVCVDQDENLYIPQWNSDRVYPVMLERINR